MEKKNLFLFIHIEKAAGTTFHNVLKNSIGEYYILKPYPKHGANLYPDQLKEIIRLAPFVRGVGGHRIKPYLNYEKTINREIKYMTILRNPIERYLSHYNHHISRGIGNYSLEEFMKKDYFHNFQTKKIAGTASSEEAIKQIKEFFYAGIVSDLSQISTSYRLNKGNYIVDKNTMKEEQLQKIYELNYEDIKLYDYVKEKNVGQIHDFVGKDKKCQFHFCKKMYIQIVVQNYAFKKNKDKIKPIQRGY